MADEPAINGVEDRDAEDFFDAENEAKIDELTQKLKFLELERADLVRGSDESKERIQELLVEIERLKSESAVSVDKIERMEKEIELAEEGQRAMDYVVKRAAELETEVSRLQHDFVSAMSEGEQSNKEIAELKTLEEEKGKRVDRLEKEIVFLKKDKAESEMKVRDLERKIGILEVRETEGKSEKLRVEMELKEKIGEKEKEIGELKYKIESLESLVKREALQLEKWKKEKSCADNAVKEWQKKATEMESKLLDLQGDLEGAEKVISEMKERAAETINGTINGLRGITDADDKGWKVQWPLLAVGSTGAVAVVAAMAYICYARHARN
ncbi:hypothetical protein SAY86_011647 [Trapa natans]|uniref:Peroxisomal and mitochondrial division factor 2-like n=1 Tax=Trapa natans TaxID=22666 RepID=A0AAN7LNK1_TRANT|nr:hypothetical protein SAY86_011647 [Trapa natans]